MLLHEFPHGMDYIFTQVYPGYLAYYDRSRFVFPHYLSSLQSLQGFYTPRYCHVVLLLRFHRCKPDFHLDVTT